MKSIAFATRDDAEARSRSEWEKTLGRPKRPEDVTEFLWGVVDGEDGAAIAVVPDADLARISLKERGAAIDYKAPVIQEAASLDAFAAEKG